jgi:hypothetical protein
MGARLADFLNESRDFIYHGGDNEGFHCLAVASVEAKSGLVIMTNGEAGTMVLQQVLLDKLTRPFWPARYPVNPLAQSAGDRQTTIAPLLSVRRGASAIEFYRKAFGAEELL